MGRGTPDLAAHRGRHRFRGRVVAQFPAPARRCGPLPAAAPSLDRVSPRPLRVPVPSALVAVVIALCAVLLLKWLAVVALIGWGVTILARGLWRRRYRPLALELDPASPRDPDHGLDLLLPDARPDGSEGEDCSWCGLAGGHQDLRGRPVRPRHAHAAARGTAGPVAVGARPSSVRKPSSV